MPEVENKIILYTADDGKSQVSLMSRDGRIRWRNCCGDKDEYKFAYCKHFERKRIG